jgi:GT2 family glycosyltransferase
MSGRGQLAAGGAAEFAVVVPTHNTRAMTLRCLQSLLAAGVPASRITVVDDASDDGTEAGVRQHFPGIFLLRNEEQRGFTRSANLGLERASQLSTPLLALINSDTVVPPSFPARAAAAFEDPAVGLWGPRLVHFDGRPQWSFGQHLPNLAWLFINASGLLHRSPPTPLPVENLSESAAPQSRTAVQSSLPQPVRLVAWLPATCIVLRRAAWVEMGPFCEAFLLYAQDLDLCSRASGRGWRIVFDSALEVMHEHGATVRQRASGARDLTSLFLDLHTWALRHRGTGWARWARWAMLAGGCCGVLVDFVRLRFTDRSAGDVVGYDHRWAAVRRLAGQPRAE